ncbi:Enoyl-CoA hydratase [Minicystis rosea]|nr:Enoyl-CoA hydratase [Minicystis rosea]
MSTSLVRYEQTAGIATITMDDGKANALSADMMDAVEQLFDRAEKEASAVVLTGRAGRFCAGFDLKQMMAGVEQARALIARGVEFLLRLYAFPLPLVVASSGHALAGGALLVATGDLRVSAAGAFRIGLNEVQIGLPVPILAMELARDRLHPQHFVAATLFATVYDPEGARTAGWVDEVAEEARLLPTATAHAQRLAALPRDAYAKTKIVMRERTIQYIRDTLTVDAVRLTPPVVP